MTGKGQERIDGNEGIRARLQETGDSGRVSDTHRDALLPLGRKRKPETLQKAVHREVFIINTTIWVSLLTITELKFNYGSNVYVKPGMVA